MPLMHFAFGGLYREGKHQEQMDMFFEYILAPKLLKSFICPEFIPIIHSPNATLGDPDSTYTTENGGVSFGKWVKSPPVGLLPNDVPMISFVDIPFKKLKKWSPSDHYGRLGLAFNDSFKEKNSVKRVSYYALPQLENDELVIKLNNAINAQDEALKNSLWKQVLHYRKPAILWKEFNGLFAPLKISAGPSGVDFEKITYSRYEIGYNFECEKESRIVTNNEGDVVQFEEEDILALIVPDELTEQYISRKLSNVWKTIPKFIIYTK